MEIKDLKIGMVVYEIIDRYHGSGSIRYNESSIEKIVIHRDSKKDYFQTVDYNEYSNKYTKNNFGEFFTFSKSSFGPLFTFSKKEAENIVANVKKIAEDREKAHEKAKLIYENNKILAEEFKHLVGNKVLLRVKDKEWIISKIKKIEPTWKENELGFWDTIKSNLWLFKREGVNWKYYTKKDELEKKKLKLEKGNKNV